MAANRRSDQRRRRVLYHAHVASHSPATPADRRAAEQLRAARSPAGAFGSRVNRHLRGRWFALVPVSGLAIGVFTGTVLLIAFSLAVMHHVAMVMPSLAYRPDVARPMRLDRPDSFGAYWTVMVLVLSAGVTYLIYGLRLHRRDDYRGHYQLWRLTTAVLLIASVHQAVGLVSWLGAVLEIALGDRAILSGANWLRLVLDVGGIVLAMRLVAELYRCRRALGALLVALAVLAWAELAAWNIVPIDSLWKSTLIVAAPALAASGVLLATTWYLRSLFRQVRGISDGPPLRDRFQTWFDRLRHRDDDNADWELRLVQATEGIAAPPAAATRTRPMRPIAGEQNGDEEAEDQYADDLDELDGSPALQEKHDAAVSRKGRKWLSRLSWPKRKRPVGATGETDSPPDQDAAEVSVRSKRRWFNWRRKCKSVATDSGDPSDSSASKKNSDDQRGSNDQSTGEKPKRKGLFSLRLTPRRLAPAAASEAKSTDDSPIGHQQGSREDDNAEAVATTKSGWLSRLWKRQPSSGDESDDEDSGDEKVTSSHPQRPQRGAAAPAKSSSPSVHTDAADEDEDLPHPDDIDWESMTKAERRRMRKRLKRAGQAA